MASCGASVCLLVLLGIVSVSGGPVQYISETMKRSQDLIVAELGLTQAEVGTYPLFSSVIKSINMSCQRKDDIQVMNATLDVYMRIFSNVLQHSHHQHGGRARGTGLLDQLSSTKRAEVVSAVRKQQKLMEKLKDHLDQHLNRSEEDELHKLRKIKVDDLGVQKKALAEFLDIYQMASVIGSRVC